MPDPTEPRKPQRPAPYKSDWSPRPVPQAAPERRTADPKTPKLKELQARAHQRASVADATRVQTPLDRGAPLGSRAALTSAPAADPEPQTLAAKRARMAQRAALVRGARERAGMLPPGAARNELLATAARFEDDTRAVDRMKLSAHVYDYADAANSPVKPDPPLGYEQLTSDDDLQSVGLSATDVEPPNSDFRAAVYRSQLDPDAKPIVVFRGTTSKDDLMQDVAQGAGLPAQYYVNALEIGKKMQRSLGPGGFETAGHSLGGGLASAVSAKYHVRGETFNAAGVSEATLARAGASRADGANRISAYDVSGEVLGAFQNHVPHGVAGSIAALSVGQSPFGGEVYAPRALGRNRVLPAADLPGDAWYNPRKYLDRHKSAVVVASFEREKAADSRALSANAPSLPFRAAGSQ